jgi:hypothetical protein
VALCMTVQIFSSWTSSSPCQPEHCNAAEMDCAPVALSPRETHCSRAVYAVRSIARR